MLREICTQRGMEGGRKRSRGGWGGLHCPLAAAPLSDRRNRTWRCVILLFPSVPEQRRGRRVRPHTRRYIRGTPGCPSGAACTHVHGISMLIPGLGPHLAFSLMFLQERRPVTVGGALLRGSRHAASRTFRLLLQNVVLLRTQA